MASRRRFDRAPLDSRYDRYSRYDRGFDRPAGPSELDQDFVLSDL